MYIQRIRSINKALVRHCADGLVDATVTQTTNRVVLPRRLEFSAAKSLCGQDLKEIGCHNDWVKLHTYLDEVANYFF